MAPLAHYHCSRGHQWETDETVLADGRPGRLLCPVCGAEATSAAAPQAVRTSTDVGKESPPRTLPPQFGRYRLVKQLGKGGMGAVYLAHDAQLDRNVALKVPHFGARAERQARERFFREARAAATLHHPGLCPVHDVGEIDGIPYVTMAYIEGRPLSEYVSPDKPLPPRQAVVVVRKLAKAMAEAHAHGVIHRDLKPANVTINRRGEPVILDFGIAWRSQAKEMRLTEDGAILGTPAYMAPEQLEGEPEAITPRCDIYSLGVILYELLTGRLPFPGPGLAIVAQILTKPPDPPTKYRPDLDPVLGAICLKALAKDPALRYGSMMEFAEVLGQYLRGMGRTDVSDMVPLVRTSASGTAMQATLNTPVAATHTSERPSSPEPLFAGEPLRPMPSPTPPLPRWVWLAGGAFLVLSLVGVLIMVGLLGGGASPSGGLPSPVAGTVHALPPVQVSFDVEDPTESAVVVDGKVLPRERLAAPLTLSAGGHEVAVMVRGEVTQRLQITLKPGEVLRVQLVTRSKVPPAKPTARDTPKERPVPSSPLAKTEPVAPRPTPTAEKPRQSKPTENQPAPPRVAPSLALAPFDAATARRLQRQWAAYVGQPLELVNSLEMRFALIPPGKFTMGTSSTASARAGDAPAHEVEITRPHYVGLYEVTQEEFTRVMGRNPSTFTSARVQTGLGTFQFRFGQRSGFSTQSFRLPDQMMQLLDTRRFPVENVSHEEALEFCRRLSELPAEKAAGRVYRLPTEAEWEHACRAGSDTPFACGAKLTARDANYDADEKPGSPYGGNPGRPAPVGSYPQNAFGLCDMHGNVWEWCADGYHRDFYKNSPDKDPAAEASAAGTRVRRGGSWASVSAACRSHARGYDKPTLRDGQTGFRVVCDIQPGTSRNAP